MGTLKGTLDRGYDGGARGGGHMDILGCQKLKQLLS